MRFPSIPKKCVPLDHPALTQIADPVPTDDPTPIYLLHLAKSLRQALKRSSSGIGIALPQLGVALQGFHIDSKVQHPHVSRFCFNPSWVDLEEGEVTDTEGCLSIADGKTKYPVTRARTIRATYTNEKGTEVVEELTGFAARVFQHESDHLDGVLISDKSAPQT
jgi:peptide deformylase